MWKRTYQKIVKGIDKEKIWKLWADIDNWPRWHDDLEYCQLKGPFAVGSSFLLKPKGVKAIEIDITEMIEGQKFSDCTQFFGAKMIDTHEIEETPDGVLLKNTLVVTGPLKYLWVHLVAKDVADTVPKEMETLIELARS